MIAPTSPASTICRVITSGLTIPLATVAATSIDTNAPAKLRNAALITASLGERARVGARGDRVRRVMEAVRKVKEQRNRHGGDKSGQIQGRYAFFTKMFPMTLAAVSQASITSSNASKMSFQRITTSGSASPMCNSSAIASRTTRSPSFSRR